MEQTTVVNINKEPYDVYIGRGSLFGNPYEVGVDGTRSEVIERFKKWFTLLLRDPVFKAEVMKLKGKRLGCFCHPERENCHGKVIANYLNSIMDESHFLAILMDDEDTTR